MRLEIFPILFFSLSGPIKSLEVKKNATLSVTNMCEKENCLKLPPGCQSDTCQAWLSLTPSNDSRVNVQMLGSDNSKYLAVGFSVDHEMGDDLVFSCSRDKVNVGYNDQHSSSPYVNDTKVKILDEKIQSLDGNQLCSFTIPDNFSLDNPGLSLQVQKEYFLLFSTGPLEEDGAISHHDSKIMSSEKVNLTMGWNQKQTTKTSKYIFIHGTFMALAWVWFGTWAIMFPVFHKKLMVKKIWGTASWFLAHWYLMTLASLFSTLGLIAILVEKKGWHYNSHDIRKLYGHPVIGILVYCLAIAQIIGGYNRPHPDHEKRWFFNLFHGSAGTIILILAHATILTASFHPAQILSTNVKYVFIGYFSISSIIAMILILLKQCFTDKMEIAGLVELCSFFLMPLSFGMAIYLIVDLTV